MKVVAYIIVFIFSQSAWAVDPYAPSISQYQLSIDPLNHQVGLGRLGLEPKISYSFFKSQQPQDLNQFLKLIEVRAPHLFDQSVIIHTSGSLQPSTAHQPRVLLFGENLTLSVSLLPGQDNRVEILQFNREDLSFSTHEILFNEAGPVFNDNPPQCLACHGQPVRPIWEAYDFWPSAVGSQSGVTHSQQEKDLLHWVQSTDHDHPLLQRINKDTLKEAIDTFTAFLTQQNFLVAGNKIKDELSEAGRLWPFRYALLGIMSCTDKSYQNTIEGNIIYREFLPESLIHSWPIRFQEVYYDVEFSNERVKNDLWAYYLRSFPGATRPSYPGLERLRVNEIVQGSQLGYLFANLGLNLRDFTTSLRQDSYIMSTPNLFDFELQKSFLYFWPELISEIGHTVKLIGGSDLEYFEMDCDQLKKKSQEELQDYQVTQKYRLQSAQKPHKGMSAIAKCATCHTRVPQPHEAQPPYIPFENTFLLGQELRETDLMQRIRDRVNRKDIKQMPKDLPHLTDQEKQSLFSTLQMIEKSTRPQ